MDVDPKLWRWRQVCHKVRSLEPLLFFIFTTPVGTLISTFWLFYHQFADKTQLYTALMFKINRDRCTIQVCRCRRRLAHRERLPVECGQNWCAGYQYTPRKCQTGPLCLYGGFRIHYTFRQKKLQVRGVTLENLTYDDNITCADQACNYHLHVLCHIRPLIFKDAVNTIVCSIVGSRLDYCDTILYGITESNLYRLQCIQNSLGRIVCSPSYRSSTTGHRKALHCLPVPEWIT